jgi:hypothetical protein
MGHQQLHTDAEHDKEDPQCRRGDWGDPLAVERLRGHWLSPGDSNWGLIDFMLIVKRRTTWEKHDAQVNSSIE